MTEIRLGGCLCGAVRFRAEGPPNWTGWCHCQSCRRHTGAPVAAYAGYDREAFALTHGAIVRFASSPGVARGFCAACGSTLTYEGERWPTEIHLHVGVFDDPNTVAPDGEAFAEERLAWIHAPDTAEAGKVVR
jgi:hypothetical protein